MSLIELTLQHLPHLKREIEFNDLIRKRINTGPESQKFFESLKTANKFSVSLGDNPGTDEEIFAELNKIEEAMQKGDFEIIEDFGDKNAPSFDLKTFDKKTNTVVISGTDERITLDELNRRFDKHVEIHQIKRKPTQEEIQKRI